MIPSLSKTIVISTLIFTVNITSTYAGDRLPFTTSAQIVVSPTTTPYPLRTRKDYSLQFQNGGGVLITPNWAMTASHVVT